MKREIKEKNNVYVQEGIDLVAEMFDYAKMHMHIEVKNFMSLFIKSGIANEIYNNNLIYIFGKSSIEITKEILEKCHYKYKIYDKDKIFSLSKEYWFGLVIASYCFLKNISFEEIIEHIDVDIILQMFNPLHEAPHEKVIDKIDEYIKKSGTNLAKYRQKIGLSQSELSKMSGVSLRSIQLYEQRCKDINKANFDNIMKLSKALDIAPQKLYECVNVDNEKLISLY